MTTGVPPTRDFDSVVRSMCHRNGVDTLPAHLAEHHGIVATRMRPLDIGVFRVDRDKAPPVVARLFAASRPQTAAVADMAVLRYLEEQNYPAERVVGDQPVSRHLDQPVLVTGFVRQVAKAKRPPYPIIRLGKMVGQLHTVDGPGEAHQRARALHHFADGTMSDELRAVAGWLESIEPAVNAAGVKAIDQLRRAAFDADGGDGLPEALVHPDPVPKNAIFTETGPVLVDWTAAGRGPRLAPLMMVLRSSWTAKPFFRGYQREISLTVDERDRFASLMFSRRLVDHIFRVCRDPSTATTAASRLDRLRRDCETTAAELLSG